MSDAACQTWSTTNIAPHESNAHSVLNTCAAMQLQIYVEIAVAADPKASPGRKLDYAEAADHTDGVMRDAPSVSARAAWLHKMRPQGPTPLFKPEQTAPSNNGSLNPFLPDGISASLTSYRPKVSSVHPL
jgi:hypothetical protein